MRLFAPFCLFMIFLAAGAPAYKLCMAQHIPPAECTRLGSYEMWVFTCTGGTITTMWGHCETQTTAVVPNSECSNDHKEKTYASSCYLDGATSNGQILTFNTRLIAQSASACSSVDIAAAMKSAIFPAIQLDIILSRVPFYL
ncbi:MAG: hypothetical protein LBL21_01310 [Rickettsiales bacterium]|nr:hypothetical protein [Rickettsiales bacterium]